MGEEGEVFLKMLRVKIASIRLEITDKLMDPIDDKLQLYLKKMALEHDYRFYKEAMCIAILRLAEVNKAYNKIDVLFSPKKIPEDFLHKIHAIQEHILNLIAECSDYGPITIEGHPQDLMLLASGFRGSASAQETAKKILKEMYSSLTPDQLDELMEILIPPNTPRDIKNHRYNKLVTVLLLLRTPTLKAEASMLDIDINSLLADPRVVIEWVNQLPNELRLNDLLVGLQTLKRYPEIFHELKKLGLQNDVAFFIQHLSTPNEYKHTIQALQLLNAPNSGELHLWLQKDPEVLAQAIKDCPEINPETLKISLQRHVIERNLKTIYENVTLEQMNAFFRELDLNENPELAEKALHVLEYFSYAKSPELGASLAEPIELAKIIKKIANISQENLRALYLPADATVTLYETYATLALRRQEILEMEFQKLFPEISPDQKQQCIIRLLGPNRSPKTKLKIIEKTLQIFKELQGPKIHELNTLLQQNPYLAADILLNTIDAQTLDIRHPA